ncbi:pilus assembly protein TadG-related protein [Actinomadura sp. SCN-SB]|uniref:pilus assembly protein TadG-related protein n=1 Tax=Actinomadura sp. SCN-SB TaxID=3373092 RepID=UPI00375050E8
MPPRSPHSRCPSPGHRPGDGDGAPISPAERGSLSIFAVIITLVVVVFFGAVVDFGHKLQARHDAYAAAQEAARAGAGQVDLYRAYAHGRYTVDRAHAVRAAHSHLRASGHTGSVTATGPRSIQVRVTITRPALFVHLIGIPTLTAHGTATADLTTEAEGPQQP